MLLASATGGNCQNSQLHNNAQALSKRNARAPKLLQPIARIDQTCLTSALRILLVARTGLTHDNAFDSSGGEWMKTFRRCTIALAVTLALSPECVGQATVLYPGSPLPRNDGITGITPPFTGEADSLSSLECVILDPAGHAVTDAAVRVRELGARALSMVAYTDSSGVVTFTQLPYGTYLVEVTSGLFMSSDRIQVDAMSGSLTIRLPGNTDAAPNNSKQTTISARQMAVPDAAQKELRKAYSAFKKHEQANAKKHVERAVDLHPGYADALALRGVLNFVEGNSDLACADLQLAISYDPSLPMPHFALAGIYNDRNDYDVAHRMATKAIALSPLLWQAHYEAARALLGKHDYKSALSEVRRAEELMAPHTFSGVALTKAGALAGIGDHATARTLLQGFIEKSPDGPAIDEARRLLQTLSP